VIFAIRVKVTGPFILEAIRAPGLLFRLAIQKSQNQGRHAVYRCPGGTISGNQPFAQRPIDVGEDVKRLLINQGVNLDDEISVKKALDSLEVNYRGKAYRVRRVNGQFW
jgi:hypothetical protein